jgi:hypothetical protein
MLVKVAEQACSLFPLLREIVAPEVLAQLFFFFKRSFTIPILVQQFLYFI